MFTASTELYDLLYEFKDYSRDARAVAEIIERERPNARSVLDVGCGTGEHAKHLLQLGDYRVTGVDIEPGFVSQAQRKLPDARFVCADMTDFDLAERFDVILCLFSSIGYVRTAENVRRTFERFRAHLNPDGVILLEPWFTPDRWTPGYVTMMCAEQQDLKVCRMSRSDVSGRLSVIEFEYLVGRPNALEHLAETHELGLFSTEEMLQLFAEEGLVASFDAEGLADRGLYIARS